jgi:hypothetical protein
MKASLTAGALALVLILLGVGPSCSGGATGGAMGTGGNGSGGAGSGRSASGGSGSGGVSSGGSGGASAGGAGSGGVASGGSGSGGAGTGGRTGAGGQTGSGGTGAGGAGGAPCNANNHNPPVATCTVMAIPEATGGTVKSGLYELRSWATTSSCASRIQESFRLTELGPGMFRMESRTEGNNRPPVNNTFEMTVTGMNLRNVVTCGSGTTITWAFSAVDVGGASELHLRSNILFYQYVRVGD